MAQFPMQRIAITAGYGPYTVNGVRKPHYGCDICSQSNTNVAACHAGKVVLSCYDSAGGNMIALQGAFNSECDIITRYAHLATRKVSLGQTVYEGQLIGVQGATGSACFGQHLHLETWLVPKGYTYNYAGRVEYSVDPLSILHVISGQTFVADDDTFYLEGIPYPEPKPADLAPCGEGAKVKIIDGGVRVRMIPYTGYPPIVKGGSDRGKDTLRELWPNRNEFAAEYKCSTTTGGTSNRWATISTPLGMFWVAIIPGYTELVDPNGAVESEPVQDPAAGTVADEGAETIAALESRIVALSSSLVLANDKITRAKEVLSEE